MELSIHQTKNIAAGVAAKSVIEAITIGIQVYDGASAIFDQSQSTVHATQIYSQLGTKLSEHIFNITHPDPLGKMVYYSSDFNSGVGDNK